MSPCSPVRSTPQRPRRDNLVGVDWLFDGLLDFLVPRTPWKLFVRAVIVAALVVAYLIAEDAGSLPWQ